MSDVVLNALGLVCALGASKEQVFRALGAGQAPGMQRTQRHSPDGAPHFVGLVETALPDITELSPRHQSRNNQLLLAALAQLRPQVDAAIARLGPLRVGVVLGTSTSGIAETEAAFYARKADGAFPARFHYGQMEIGSPSELLSELLGLCGPAFTLSTACASSAKALASARRLLLNGTCDAVIAGGADSLCQFTQAGFAALGALSPDACLPFQADRRGINIGEGAALFLITREGEGPHLAGAGESSDAHHISAPKPDGLGAAQAIRAALLDAGVGPEALDYVNAHGTGTAQNDAMESRALVDVLGPGVPVSSTKPLSGHTLGAAGALEAAFCWLLLAAPEPPPLPVQLPKATPDPAISPIRLVTSDTPRRPLRTILSTSFGFGGSNAALILRRGE